MKKFFGFTLIELIVAVTIGLLVLGFGIVVLNDFNQRQKLEAVKNELMANLRLARNYAITNNLPQGGNRVLMMVDGVGNLVMQSRDAGDSGVEVISSKNIGQKNIGISIPNVRFSVTDGRSIGGSVVATVVGDDGVTRVIKIDESGLIYEQ